MTPTPSQIFAANLRWHRKVNGMTLKGLVEELEKLGHRISLNALGRIERGKRGATLDDLVAISKAVGVEDCALLKPITTPAQSFIEIAPPSYDTKETAK